MELLEHLGQIKIGDRNLIMRDYKNQKLKKGYGENMKKKVLCLVAIFVLMMGCLVGCDIEVEADGTSQDKMTTQEVASKLANNQPTPTDIDYSLERYNLIKRAYWVNGQREKANTLPCEIEKPLGYIVLFTESGSIIGSFVVDGKVSSLNSYLSPDSEAYEIGGESTDSKIYNNGTEENDWLSDVDGSYGENDNGIFFFTTDGKYIEWTGTYLYSDIPFIVDEPVLKVGE